MKQPFGPAGDNDARGAYLFVCPRTNCYGITLDKSGANLPDQGCEEGWQLQAEFPLGIREALPPPMDPEAVIRGIKANGYFVWRSAGDHCCGEILPTQVGRNPQRVAQDHCVIAHLG